MPRVSTIGLLKRSEQPTLVVRTTTGVKNLPGLIGKCYGEIAAYLDELGEFPADIPFVAYHNMDMQNLDVEIGFPISSKLPGRGDIVQGSIPEGLNVFSVFMGPYAQMESVYSEMAEWITKNGFISTGVVYEHYYSGPEFPESQHLTKIVMPLKKPE
jgi:effector-binding domain-containing protein